MKKTSYPVRYLLPMLLLGLVTACATTPPTTGTTYDSAKKEMSAAARARQSGRESDAVGNALLPPMTVEMPNVDGRPIEPRFDLAVNNAPAGQVFLAIVSGTRYSMVVHPGVKDQISVNLRDVTVFEALDTIREVYGYEYKVQGNRILVEPLSLQTRVYQVNYLMSLRKGKTEVRVMSGAISDSSNTGPTAQPVTTNLSGAPTTTSLERSRVSTTSTNDFCAEIDAALRAIVGKEGGRNVVMSPQAGVVGVRALPSELRGVAEFLKTMQVVVERQVMLEAKIIDVELSDSHQTGVNWAAFGQGANSRVSGGVLRPDGTLTTNGTIGGFPGHAPDWTVSTHSPLSWNPAA